MAVDYLFVGIVFTFVMGLSFTILGWESDFPRDVMYTMWGTIACFTAGFLSLGTDNSWMIALSFFYWGLGLLDFVLVMLMGIDALKIYRRRKQGYE